MTDPWALTVLGLGLAVFAAVTVRLGWLSVAGAAAAFVLGTATGWQFGFAGLAALLFTFLVTTLLSKLPGRGRSGARTLRQVVVNGAGPFAGVVIHALGLDSGQAVFLAGLAFLGSDTSGAELGTRFGGTPRLLPTFRAGAPGESGGVTLIGTLASVGGAWLPVVPYVVVAAFGGEGLASATALGVAALGFAGSVVDSLLGATLQYRGRIMGTGAPTERTAVGGAPTERVRGMRLLDNDGVNLVGGLAAAALALLL